MGLETGTVLAIMAVVSTVASTAAAVYTASQASDAQEYNAQVAEAQGAQAQLSAEAEAEDRRRRARYLLGQQLVAAGSSGIALEGSPLLVMVDSGVQEDLEARRIRYKGYLEASGMRSQAALSRYQAGQTTTAGYINAGTSLLRGAGNTYRAYNYSGTYGQGTS